MFLIWASHCQLLASVNSIKVSLRDGSAGIESRSETPEQRSLEEVLEHTKRTCFEHRADVFRASKLRRLVVHKWLWVLIAHKARRVKTRLASRNMQIRKLRSVYDKWRESLLHKWRWQDIERRIEWRRRRGIWHKWRAAWMHEMQMSTAWDKRAALIRRRVWECWLAYVALWHSRTQGAEALAHKAIHRQRLVLETLQAWNRVRCTRRAVRHCSERARRKMLQQVVLAWHARQVYKTMKHRRQQDAHHVFMHRARVQATEWIMASAHARHQARVVAAKEAAWERCEEMYPVFEAWKSLTKHSVHRSKSIPHIPEETTSSCPTRVPASPLLQIDADKRKIDAGKIDAGKIDADKRKSDATKNGYYFLPPDIESSCSIKKLNTSTSKDTKSMMSKEETPHKSFFSLAPPPLSCSTRSNDASMISTVVGSSPSTDLYSLVTPSSLSSTEAAASSISHRQHFYQRPFVELLSVHAAPPTYPQASSVNNVFLDDGGRPHTKHPIGTPRRAPRVPWDLLKETVR